MIQKLKHPVRYLFGALWLVFGLNFFFQFLPMPPPKPEMAGFFGALVSTGYFLQFVKIVEVLAGVLLLANLFVPLTLVVLASVTINIILLHAFLDPSGLPMGIFMAAIHIFLGICYMDNYRNLLKAKVN
jgi:putative oxidoreductase